MNGPQEKNMTFMQSRDTHAHHPIGKVQPMEKGVEASTVWEAVKPHYQFTRLNLKKMGSLLFCNMKMVIFFNFTFSGIDALKWVQSCEVAKEFDENLYRPTAKGQFNFKIVGSSFNVNEIETMKVLLTGTYIRQKKRSSQ